MIPCPKKDIVATGLARLTQAYKGKPVITAILTGALEQMQELEDVTWDVINGRLLGTTLVDVPAVAPGSCDADVDLTGADEALVTLDASGAALDKLAALVGERARSGRTDAELIVAIKTKIRANTSDGLAENLIQLVAGGLPPGVTFTYEQPSPKPAFIVEILGAFTASRDLALSLRTARMGGVRGGLRYAEVPRTDVFAWSTATGASDGHGLAYLPDATFTSTLSGFTEL